MQNDGGVSNREGNLYSVVLRSVAQFILVVSDVLLSDKAGLGGWKAKAASARQTDDRKGKKVRSLAYICTLPYARQPEVELTHDVPTSPRK